MQVGDIGIIKVKKDLSQCAFFRFNPICLPSLNAQINKAQELLMTAWGRQHDWDDSLKKSKGCASLFHVLSFNLVTIHSII